MYYFCFTMSTHDIIRQMVKLSREQGIFIYMYNDLLTFDIWPYDPQI